eukprot:TRINITY_DN771_c0_g1_i10.p1 TRINITY_DN771_c0_g1~~TRINITY_DN771_c0_g1_i10.p1  ORF type:complete len:178 (+),score=25.51 TRINITY_DN771_c0_g1_i10:383-916(+)
MIIVAISNKQRSGCLPWGAVAPEKKLILFSILGRCLSFLQTDWHCGGLRRFAQEVTEDILMEAWDKCREKNMDMTRAVASVPTRAHTQLQVISSRPPLPAHALLPTLGLQQQQQQQQLSSLISCLCSPPSRVHLVPCHPVLYKIVLSHHQCETVHESSFSTTYYFSSRHFLFRKCRN